jgi:hypothetical protein
MNTVLQTNRDMVGGFLKLLSDSHSNYKGFPDWVGLEFQTDIRIQKRKKPHRAVNVQGVIKHRLRDIN